LESSEECYGKFPPSFLDMRVLIGKEVQKQLISYCERNSIVVIPQTKYDADAILKAFLSGFILNTAFLQMDGSYRTSFSHHVRPHSRTPPDF
jgi:hypothetical protein